jgi:NAD(P)-dependent dehydrogenase (short-subunit alcohol dehydrogenase family)
MSSSAAEAKDCSSIEGSCVIVTGGSTGIGSACIDEFLRLGAARVFNIDISERKASDERVETRTCDVSKADLLKSTVEAILAECTVDFVIAVAGVHLFSTVESTSEEMFDRLLGINVKGVFFALQAVIPALKKQGHGSIVLMGSDQSLVGKENQAMYGMTKACVGHLTKSTAIDLAKFNIRCNCICPGTVDTPLVRNAIAKVSRENNIPVETLMEGLKTAQPLPRIAQPKEIAFVVASVARATYMTGALVPVDGGYTCQ